MSKIEYSDADKKRIRGMVKAFSGARGFLDPRYGVCHALYKWYVCGEGRVEAYQDSIELMQRSLGWDNYLEGFVGYGNGHPASNPHAVDWRKAWLDKLIKDCKEAIK
ncbi:hypothetical protein [Xanthomonas sp. LMG 12461]|uniref:hypothetical protein n=1 Tax=Xanthomonas sp. LMG 12461 TaxID=2014543 RepID=UPI00126534AD|nr:hypothetical protein [Xanthomonas sp. LMG 12461]